MKNEKINQTQLAKRLGMTKGRVSQILRGESNFSMKTLIELGLSIGVIPKINYVPIEQEIIDDSIKKLSNLNAKVIVQTLLEKKTEITIDGGHFLKRNTEHLNSGSSTADGGYMVTDYKGYDFIPFVTNENKLAETA